MARQSPISRSINENAFEDEVDLMELLHFLAKSTRYWVLGGLLAGLLGLAYALTLYPSTYRQQTINDIALNHEQLNLIRGIIPAMTTPLKETMRAQGLDDLYEEIIKNPDYLDKTILGISGVDLKDRDIDKNLKNKIDTVRILVKGKDEDRMQREVKFIQNTLRGISQYLSVKQYLVNEAREAKLQLFNTESQVNRQQLNYERAERQLAAYERLQKEPNEQRDLQIILNLSNNEEQVGNKASLNNITEFSGAKYLPLGNRILGLKSEMADQMEAIFISKQQIKALKLSQSVLNQLNGVFESILYQGDVIDLTPMIQVIHDYRQQVDVMDFTREEIAALDNLERNLISFERNGQKFNNTLPAIYEQKGRGKLTIIATILGGLFGFLVYLVQVVFRSYRQRYPN